MEKMNPFKTILSLLLILSLTVVACSDDSDDNGEDVDPSDFPLEALLNEEQSFMIVAVEEFGEEFDAYMSMMILEDHDNVTLKIDGNDVSLSSFFGFYFADLDLMPEQSFSFELTVDGNSRSGSLSIPAVVQGTFPSEFDLSSDYSLSWTTSSDPTGFIAFLQIELEDDWIDQGNMLSGSERSHTFNRGIYSGLSEDDIWYVDVGVLSMNFTIKDNMIFLAGFDAYQDYDFDADFTFKQTDRNVDADRPRGRFPAMIMNRKKSAQ